LMTGLGADEMVVFSPSTKSLRDSCGRFAE
jgi:hypothetical protein